MSARNAKVASINPSADLKRLQTKRSSIQKDIALIEKDLSDTEKAYRLAVQELKVLDEQIDKLTKGSKAPIVSEHALLRYAERVLKVDFAKVRSDILSPHMVEMIKFTKSGRIKGAKYDLVVKDCVVTTVLTEDGD